MKRLASLVLASMIGGCALVAWTPQDLRTQGVRIETSASMTPMDVAHCVSRNAEKAGMIATARPYAGANAEVLIRAESLGPMAAVEIYGTGPASRVVAFIRPIWDQTPDVVARGLVRGC